ncbi:MAG: AGE family epimerase/isomerase [Robiginitomaculum sp.]
MENFLKQSAKFTHWCQQDALPYWAKFAHDPEGGYYEQLALCGAPDIDHSRRVRVQARQAYVYAHAAHMGWFDGARAASDHAWNYLMGPGCQGGETVSGTGYKGCAHLLNADGSLLDGQRDSYAQAFVILAGAWRYMAFKDEASLKTAYDTLAFLDSHAAASNGGWLEGVPPSLPRRQNPHMHLFEALMALYDATGDAAILERVGRIYTLFTDIFFEPMTRTIIEFFYADWRYHIGNGGPVEPGHMLEWCWLLREYSRRSGVDVDHYADGLYDSAVKLGRHPKLGLISDTVNMQLGKSSGTYRTWPQTEYLKASIVQAQAGREGMDNAAGEIIETIFKRYLSVEIKGGWVDKLGRRGEIIEPIMPTSTFYHILGAAAIASDHAANLRDSDSAYPRPILA